MPGILLTFASMNYMGIIIGVSTFLIIGLFHPIVIKSEYYIGKRCWWVFLLAGLAAAAGSLFVADIVVSTLMGGSPAIRSGNDRIYRSSDNLPMSVMTAPAGAFTHRTGWVAAMVR